MAVDVAELGIKVTATGVTETARAISEVGNEAGKAEKKVDSWRLSQQKMLDQLARFENLLSASLSVQNAMAASLDRLGASTTRMGSAADNLRAKYDPLAAAGVRYSAALKDIDKAQQDGILSSQVAARARQSELSAMNTQIAAVERLAQVQKTAAQAAVNKQTITPDRGADIAAYGAELDKLRAKYNPLFAAGREYRDTLNEINQAAKIGAISERERSDALVRTKSAFADQVASLRGMKSASADAAAGTEKLGEQVGLARFELINLSRQAQDVVVSLQGGQGLGTVLLQQGSQIGDVFVSSKATLGSFFTQAAGWALRFATSMVGAFTVVGAVVTGGIAAFISYRNAQEAIQLSLMGVGRASGVTAQQLNEVGKAASSLSGLSTSEATEFATALAATGRVAQESLLPATQTAKNLAKVLGTDLATAAGVMGQALAGNLDPINQRLGAFSVATQEQIKLLISQNREAEAQAIITKRVTDATLAASEATTGWSRAWTALGNVVSDFWRGIGRAIDAATGNKPLADQYTDALAALDKLKAKRAELEKSATPSRSGITSDQQDRINFFLRLNPAADQVNKNLASMDDDIAKAETAANKLKTAMDTVKTATEQTKAAMQSVADAATSAALAPEIAARRALANQTASATSIAQNPVRQSAIGITQAEADEQVKRAKGVEDSYRTASQKIAEGFEIANKAITAFSPRQKAEIAQLETAARLRDDPTMSPESKRAAAQEAYNNALKQGNVALSEAARARGLSAQQAVDSSKLEVDLVGKSIGQQTELRANLQAKQALEQQASQQRTGFDDAEYERLKRKNAELGKTAQLVALTQIRDQIKEDRQTIGFSQEDLQIAQALKQAYPDIVERMNSAEAAQIRLNNSLRNLDQIQRDAFGDFLQNLRQGKTVADSLTAAFGSMADKLAKIGGDKLFDSLKSGTLFSAANDNSKSGIVEGFEEIQKRAAAARANPNNSFNFNSAGGAVGGGLTAAAAGIGIYGQSKQQGAAGGSVASGALSGGLTGALAGFAVGGPIGAVIGGIGGAIAGLFGASEGARQAANQARDAWAANKTEALNFARVLAGGGNGSLSQAFSQARGQLEQYVDAANKAGDTTSTLSLQDSFYKFIDRSAREFRQAFGGVVDALNSGLGTSSPFASAAANVKSVGDALKGFVDDTRKAFASDPVRAGVTGQDDGGGAAQVAQATAAAQKYLLSLLGQAPVLSDVAQAVQHLSGTATQLQTTLVDLGMSSEQAAQAINAGVVSAMAALAATFANGLEREINTALGQDYLNSTADLIARRTTALSDAATLGTGTQLVDRWFSVSAQKLVDDAKLTGAAFDDLTTRFPELQGAVHAFSEAVDQSLAAIASRVSGFQDRLFAATNDNTTQAGALAAFDRQANQQRAAEVQAGGQAINDLEAALAAERLNIVKDFAAKALLTSKEQINYQTAALAQLSTAQSEYTSAQSALTSAYNDQKGILDGLISAGKGFVDQFAKLKASLRLNDSLSPLSAQEKYLQAQAQARDTAALAAGGDATAQARLADNLNEYLNQSKSFNASTLSYYNDFTEVQNILDQAGATAQSQVDVAQQQLATLNQQVAGLIAINNSVQTVAQGIANLLLAQSNLAAAQQNVNAQQDFGIRPLINQMIQRGLDDAGIHFTGNYGPNGNFGQFVASQTASTQAIINAIAQTVPQSLIDFYARQGLQNGGIVGAFASGGMIGNGTYGVDSVLARYAGGGNIALAGGEYVMPANQTRANMPALEAMRSGRGAGNDNSETNTLLRAIVSRLERVEAATLGGASHVRDGVDKLGGVQKRSADETRQAANQPAPYGGTRKAG